VLIQCSHTIWQSKGFWYSHPWPKGFIHTRFPWLANRAPVLLVQFIGAGASALYSIQLRFDNLYIPTRNTFSAI